MSTVPGGMLLFPHPNLFRDRAGRRRWPRARGPPRGGRRCFERTGAVYAGPHGRQPARRVHGGIIVAKFEHDTARPVDGYAAPQLHTHAVIFNVTERADGTTRALQERGFFESQQFATAVYQSELTFRLRELGYETEPGRSGAPEIKGYSQSISTPPASARTRSLEHMKQNGLAGYEAAEISAHATRDKNRFNRPPKCFLRTAGSPPSSAISPIMWWPTRGSATRKNRLSMFPRKHSRPRGRPWPLPASAASSARPSPTNALCSAMRCGVAWARRLTARSAPAWKHAWPRGSSSLYPAEARHRAAVHHRGDHSVRERDRATDEAGARPRRADHAGPSRPWRTPPNIPISTPRSEPQPKRF